MAGASIRPAWIPEVRGSTAKLIQTEFYLLTAEPASFQIHERDHHPSLPAVAGIGKDPEGDGLEEAFMEIGRAEPISRSA